MASGIYNSFFEDVFKGDIDFDTATIKCMLVTSSYTENFDTHDRRDDITNEVTGTGYTTGGATATCSVAQDDANDRVEITLGGISLSSATVTARKAIYYVAAGGASSGDRLIACIDFGSDVTSTGGTWALTASTLRVQR